MKIAKNVRDLYSIQEEKYSALKEDVDTTLYKLCFSNGWFYNSRIKALQSFALKLETGRIPIPERLEDFLGCTIVVPTINQIDTAEEIVLKQYSLVARRPTTDTETSKEPSDFRFDDLRLHLHRVDTKSGLREDLSGLIFEVQIKTALQYAWGVATHDLTYKSGSISWPLERIAFQLKAMLEHAEVAIASAEHLAVSPHVAKVNPTTKKTLRLIGHVHEKWTSDRLPSDVKRLATSILAVLEAIKTSVDEFIHLIDEEQQRFGTLAANMSPYSFFIQAVAHFKADELRAALESGLISVFIHDEMDCPEWLSNLEHGVIKL